MTTKPAMQPPAEISSDAPPAEAPPAETRPAPPARIEPLPDPKRKPDAMRQYHHISGAYHVLFRYFRRRPDVLVASEGYLCHYADDRSDYVVPDCIVAFGVNPVAIRDQRNGYVISEVGKPPEFVLEVASESTGKLDYMVKPGIYAGFGVAEYWRFDRTGGRLHDAPLAGDRLVAGAYQPIELSTGADGMLWGYSEVLGLYLCWDRGRLRFYDPVREDFLPDPEETADLAEAEAAARAAAEARADAEAAARADEARARAAAEARADAAEAELRRLRREARE